MSMRRTTFPPADTSELGSRMRGNDTYGIARWVPAWRGNDTKKKRQARRADRRRGNDTPGELDALRERTRGPACAALLIPINVVGPRVP